jgi:hypothetical protein
VTEVVKNRGEVPPSSQGIFDPKNRKFGLSAQRWMSIFVKQVDNFTDTPELTDKEGLHRRGPLKLEVIISAHKVVPCSGTAMCTPSRRSTREQEVRQGPHI